MAPARGSALLIVIAATAGLGVMVAMLLLSGRVAYEISGLRADGLQAAALAEATVRQAAQALQSGALALPAPDRPVRVTNGMTAGGLPVPVARFPRPRAAARWPAVTAAPEGSTWGGGLGAAAEITVVTGPRGEVRSRAAGADGMLLRVSARAWFRRGRAQRSSSLLWVAGMVTRLD